MTHFLTVLHDIVVTFQVFMLEIFCLNIYLLLCRILGYVSVLEVYGSFTLFIGVLGRAVIQLR